MHSFLTFQRGGGGCNLTFVEASWVGLDCYSLLKGRKGFAFVVSGAVTELANHLLFHFTSPEAEASWGIGIHSRISAETTMLPPVTGTDLGGVMGVRPTHRGFPIHIISLSCLEGFFGI